MNFQPDTQIQLKQLNIIDGNLYLIEYLNKDYFNGDENLEMTKAKAIINDDIISFMITDDYGMEKFINRFRVIK